MAKVYIVQEPGDKNILPAREFGEFKVLLLNTDIRQGTEHCLNVLAGKLLDVSCNDCILPIGDPFYIGIATAIALHYSQDGINILRYSRENITYNKEFVNI
jgi:hypothetical protein